MTLIKSPENNMKSFIKYLTLPTAIGLLLISLSCDDRIPDSTATSNATLVISQMQSISDDGTSVGEVVSGSSNMRLVATLKNDTGIPLKDKTIKFAHDGTGGSFESGTSVTTDENGQVVNIFKPNSSENMVDKTTTPEYEGLTVTVIYESSLKATAEFNVYPNQDDVWPYTMYVTSDVDNIKLDNGETTAQITAQLFNKTNTPLHNVILLFNSNKGYIDGEGTTDSTGSVTMTFRDNGDQEDIGLANIICSFNHSGFDSEIADTVNVRIGSNNNLILETTPISYENGSSQILVGEDIIGDIALTRIVATILDTSGNGISGQIISLKATSLGASVGSLEIISSETDHEGKFYAYFDDGGNSYLDIAGTTEFDGVVITAYLGDSTSTTTAISNLNVYPDDAWPYLLYLNSDVDQILLDNGVTTAEIEARVVNQYDALVKNVTLNFESDKGTIDPTGVTDSTGVITLTFSDNGTQDDIGLANIQASFEHPGFSATVTDSVQIAIGTNNGLALEIIPVSYDETGPTVIVGEDIAGNASGTLLVATVMDTLQNPISGIPVEFLATSGSSAVGTISYINTVSNAEGQVVGYFDDGGTVYTDNPGTPNYEGVSVVAYFGDKVTDPQTFNVYDEEDVWPYSLYLTTDTDVIQLDGGETYANLVARLLNKLGNPVDNAQIAYSATKGYINSVGYTDSTGVDSVIFTDLGDEEDLGVSDITATFIHPGFEDNPISDLLQIYIEDPTFQQCTYINIPASVPGSIVVENGGGTESTMIRAELFDDNDNLINTPTLVRFKLHPILDGCYLEEPGVTDTTVYTVNGVASVSVNSGTRPGPIRVEISSDCDGDGTPEIESVAVPVIIEAGPPYYIQANWSVESTEETGGCIFKRQVAALVYDRYSNPVEDSTYVYWKIEPVLPDTVISAEIYGTSFTNNEPWQAGADTAHGVAFSTMLYTNDFQGQNCIVTAYTWGGDLDGDGVYGDSVGAIINPEDGFTLVSVFDPEVTLSVSQSFHDFTIPVATNEVAIMLTARITSACGESVEGIPIGFSGVGVTEWREVGLENFDDYGIDTVNNTNDQGEGDGCFTWRDYGIDDDPQTLDWGTWNDQHDSFDTDGDGLWDANEFSENFEDYGFDQIDGTFDEGENNGYWDGYHMIGCEPIVKTDQDGYAQIIAVFPVELCVWQSFDEANNLCSWEGFDATVFATSLVPEIVASNDVAITLQRSPTAGPCF